MIIGGSTSSSSKKARKTYLRMVQNIQLTGYAPKMVQVDNPVIASTKKMPDVSTTHMMMHPQAVYG